MSSASWYHELTGRAPSRVPMLPLSHALSVFGEWDDARIQSDLIAPLLVCNEIELTSYQQRLCKPVPEAEPKARLFNVPTHQCGCTIVMGIDDERGKAIISVGPTSEAGSQHCFQVRRAHLFPDRVTAILEGELLVRNGTDEPMRLPMAFHDRDFALCRGYYHVGRVSDFVIAGIALMVASVQGNGTAQFLALDSVCLSCRHFRGKVVSVEPMFGFGPIGEMNQGVPHMDNLPLIHGQRVWRVKTLIGEAPDLAIDLVVTERATHNSPDMLTAGAWIDGIAVMTGHCLWLSGN